MLRCYGVNYWWITMHSLLRLLAPAERIILPPGVIGVPFTLGVWKMLCGLSIGGGVYIGGESYWKFEHEMFIGLGRWRGLRTGVVGGFLNILSWFSSDLNEGSASLSRPSFAIFNDEGEGGGGQYRFAWCSEEVTTSWGRKSIWLLGMCMLSSAGRSRFRLLWLVMIMFDCWMLPIDCTAIPLFGTFI